MLPGKNKFTAKDDFKALWPAFASKRWSKNDRER